MKRWYVVQTKSNQEAIALQQLKNQNFNVFCPKYVSKRINSRGKLIQSIHPLFPSYIFVEFDEATSRWRSINGTRGVFKLIGCSEEYLSPLPECYVSEIMASLSDAGYVELEEAIAHAIDFSSDKPLQITMGSMKGMIATYCNHSKDRVVILLSLLNRKVRVSLPIDAVCLVPISGDLR